MASLWATPLQHDASAFSGTQPPQMCEDGAALHGGKVGQINNHLVEPLLQQMPGNLPQKGLDVEPSRRDRPHRIVGDPLLINLIACPRRITSQWPNPLF